jgi:aldehyde dehydrogenase (NAD+)
MRLTAILENLEINLTDYLGDNQVISPISEEILANIAYATDDEYNTIITKAQDSFLKWRTIPAPQRGLFVKAFGEVIRSKKEFLAGLITLETGKIFEEAKGEVQEVIDICDFALGLSRQLYGLTIASERKDHRLFEQWHPLGIVGVVTAFNFPMAVWAWNAIIGCVCGNSIVWKPSPKTPLCAIVLSELAKKTINISMFPCSPFYLILGGNNHAVSLANDTRISLLSATGSTVMGEQLAPQVAARLGRSLLELGGNNCVIVDENAPFDLALRSVLFGALGTAGQRCTSTRRVLIHKTLFVKFNEHLVSAYKNITIGDPFDCQVLMGPLIDKNAVNNFQERLRFCHDENHEILCGGEVLPSLGFYVTPAIVKIREHSKVVLQETFAPLLYVQSFSDIEEAIEINNSVSQGLSSALFTLNLRSAELFLSSRGSDCGIANINIGTSGAEIGGAFGGEKASGGGRESGSDSWKGYMRRQTCTINWSTELPLAQGVKFSL